ncbi:hypothetical protein [Rhizobium sp. CCGE 510]|uniref:hypothetical protein n=1 Tax=Rhizobium sp. CCGE 510 TaxID=1132836 RepID=UPI00178C2C12|nr:hypothetical protein [Rhizobium sp. CCGE 510]
MKGRDTRKAERDNHSRANEKERIVETVHCMKRGHGCSTSRFSENMSMGDNVTPERGAADRTRHHLQFTHDFARKSILIFAVYAWGLDRSVYFFGALPCGAVVVAVFIWLANVLSVLAACLSFFGFRTSRLLLTCPFAMDKSPV